MYGAYSTSAKVQLYTYSCMQGLGWRGSKFKRTLHRDVGGLLVGGIDIMMSSEPISVIHLACSPLLPHALCVAKRTCHHTFACKEY
jgi:hypothetical protein